MFEIFVRGANFSIRFEKYMILLSQFANKKNEKQEDKKLFDFWKNRITIGVPFKIYLSKEPFSQEVH